VQHDSGVSRSALVVATAVLSALSVRPTPLAGQKSCELARADSVYLEGGPVYRDCAVDRRAKLLGSLPVPNLELVTPPTGTPACWTAEIQFVVDSAGEPELMTVRVLRTSDPSFADAVIATLPQWKYQPAVKDGVAVRQIVRQRRGLSVQRTSARPGDVRPGPAPLC
jgi:TonB-like protein